jgi:hypothetical protein
MNCALKWGEEGVTILSAFKFRLSPHGKFERDYVHSSWFSSESLPAFSVPYKYTTNQLLNVRPDQIVYILSSPGVRDDAVTLQHATPPPQKALVSIRGIGAAGDPHHIAFHVPNNAVLPHLFFQRLSAISSTVLGTKSLCSHCVLPPFSCPPSTRFLPYPHHESISRSCCYTPDSHNHTLWVFFQHRRHLRRCSKVVQEKDKERS